MEGLKKVKKINYDTVKARISRNIYDLALAYIREKYLNGATDPNVMAQSVGATPPRRGSDVHTLSDMQEEQAKAVFEESKTGSGLRFKNGRFKRFR